MPITPLWLSSPLSASRVTKSTGTGGSSATSRYWESPSQRGPETERGYGLWNHPLDGVAEAIGDLRREGIRVAVVSNSDGSVGSSLERAGLADMFEFVIDSHQVGISKPDPEIFRVALDRMGVDPSDAWFVGDSVFHDVNGATAASMARAVLVDPYDLGPEEVDRVGSVADLVSSLETPDRQQLSFDD